MFPNETIHSQKITLVDGDNPSNKTFFSTINDSANASANGDTITLDAGNYTDIAANLTNPNTGGIEIPTTVTLTNGPDATTEPSITRVNTSLEGGADRFSTGFNDS
ncbi:MAG: hypothetical protein ABEI52_07885, partial [Halobacteriaceae archaeon]